MQSNVFLAATNRSAVFRPLGPIPYRRTLAKMLSCRGPDWLSALHQPPKHNGSQNVRIFTFPGLPYWTTFYNCWRSPRPHFRRLLEWSIDVKHYGSVNFLHSSHDDGNFCVWTKSRKNKRFAGQSHHLVLLANLCKALSPIFFIFCVACNPEYGTVNRSKETLATGLMSCPLLLYNIAHESAQFVSHYSEISKLTNV